VIALWIAGILIALVLLRYAYLIAKRLRLLRKIKKHADKAERCRSILRSVFRRDGKPDLIVIKGNRKFTVSVLTTPFRRVRYHFNANEKLEIHYERKGMYVLNPRVPQPTADIDRSFIIKKYKFTYETSTNADQWVIAHPAPRSLTRADVAELKTLGNGDTLFGSIRICGLQYFLEFVLDAR